MPVYSASSPEATGTLIAQTSDLHDSTIPHDMATTLTQQQPVLIPTASLHNKVALITGASRGIGRGCALELARRGASIIVNYGTSASAAAAVVAEIEAIGAGTATTGSSVGIVTSAKAVAIKADVSQVGEIERLFDEGIKEFGKVDIVMSNSGAECWDKTEDVTEEKFDVSIFSPSLPFLHTIPIPIPPAALTSPPHPTPSHHVTAIHTPLTPP